jgi:hypothetical protein
MTPSALIRRATLIASVSLLPGLRAERQDPVAVLGSADPAYVKQKFPDNGGKPKAESYFFAQGSFFAGSLPDGSLEKAKFGDIVRVLAPALAKQEYYPSGNPKEADLLIVVHWGQTDVDAMAQSNEGGMFAAAVAGTAAAKNGNLSAAERGNAMASANLSADAAELEQRSLWNSMAFNEQLLGYADAIRLEEYRSQAVASGMTEADLELRTDVLEERYLVILMAYDFRTLKKGSKPRLLWSAHFNMASVGHSFTTALPAMSEAAAKFLGRSTNGLIVNARRVPEGRVDMGEPKVVPDSPKRD